MIVPLTTGCRAHPIDSAASALENWTGLALGEIKGGKDRNFSKDKPQQVEKLLHCKILY